MFDKTPNLVPQLVKLHESHRLSKLVKDNNPESRAEVIGAVAGLLEFDGNDLSVVEEELIADVLIELMRQAERDIRQTLSTRLAALDNVPLRLVLHMANDEIEIASPILEASQVLTDLDLLYIAKSHDAPYWRSIAKREGLSGELIDTLVNTGDVDTAVNLTENDRIILTDYAVEILADMAEEEERIAKPLLMRDGVPETVARRLYHHVGEELKSFVRDYYGVVDKDVLDTVDAVVAEYETKKDTILPDERLKLSAKNMAERGMLNMQSMLDALSRGEVPFFVSQFSIYTGIPAKEICGLIKQACPKGLAVVCRALGVQKSDFSKIYLMTHRVRSNGGAVNSQDMAEILRYFDRVRPEAASRIMASLTTA